MKTHTPLTAQQPAVGRGLLTVQAFRSHSRHATFGTTPLEGWSARQGDLNVTTHNIL